MKKMGDRQCFCEKRNWNTLVKSGEYHPFLLFIGIFNAAYLAGHDSSSFLYKCKAASMVPRLGSSP